MAKTEEEKERNFWKITGKLGDFFGVLSTIICIIMLVKTFITKEIELLTDQASYLIVYCIIGVLCVGEFFKFVMRNSLTKYKMKKVNLENEEIINIYEKIKNESYQELNEVQKKTKYSIVLKNVFFYSSMFGVLIIIAFLNETKMFLNLFWLAALLVIIALIGLLCSFLSLIDTKDVKLKKFTKMYQDKLVLPILNSINSSLVFVPDIEKLDKENKEKYGLDFLSYKAVRELYEESEISNEYYNRFLIDDLIIDMNEELKLYEINSARKIKINGRVEYKSYFKGIFTEFDILKDINGVIKIRSNAIKKAKSNEKCVLGIENFEKYFWVNADNSNELNEVVTNSVADTLIQLYEETNMAFEIVLKNKKVYVRVLTGEMFEPKLKGNVVDINDVARYYYSVYIIKELKKLFD